MKSLIDREKIEALKRDFRKPSEDRFVVPKIVSMMMVDKMEQQDFIYFTNSGYRFSGGFFKLYQRSVKRATDRIREELAEFEIDYLLMNNLIEKTLVKSGESIAKEISYTKRDRERERRKNRGESRISIEEKCIDIRKIRMECINMAVDFCTTMAQMLMGEKKDKDGKEIPLYLFPSDIFDKMKESYVFED